MAGSNKFYPFAQNSTNILSDAQYQADTERTGGSQPGAIARSAINNKALRQGTMMAAALGAAVAAVGFQADDSDLTQLTAVVGRMLAIKASTVTATVVTLSGSTYTALIPDLLGLSAADLPDKLTILLTIPEVSPASAQLAIITQAGGEPLITAPIYSDSTTQVGSGDLPACATSLLLDMSGTSPVCYLMAGGGGGSGKVSSVTLTAAGWTQDPVSNLYTQIVTVSGLTANCKVDFDTDVVTASNLSASIRPVNNNGVLSAVTVEPPTEDIAVQVTVTKVAVS